ncbi:hypothetical protein Z517_02398 [Fonsecaea pedrosoi CBS 271.37]|uniref:Rhodanese domain-containing protein n=1 Tax=Fonsecaea pedrosoi CBS 271.37 TaxID=1442368 RepID=A0A0D2HFE2_9EURO|nr:uncharacterized protein Z517_02398 [Fonsecaea pedrosoi CBS 271.37]KIW83154.1 hypothetical protein Z517_02398 [Fonsecaea pedrosoi CBS 271.37]
MASVQPASSLRQCLRTISTSTSRRAITCSSPSSTIRLSLPRRRLASSQASQASPCLPPQKALDRGHSMPRLRQPKRHFTGTRFVARNEQTPSSEPQPSTLYTFADMQSLTSHPAPNRVIIDVREPSELKSTGKIPGAQNLPIKSAADGFFLGPDEFEERFGWEKPTAQDEVIFYCKAGVRSRAAAGLAAQAAFGGKISEFPGSWIEWAEKGGEVEKVEE